MENLVDESRVIKTLERLPKEIQSGYFVWRDIVSARGFNGLRSIRGFRFEKLKGDRVGQYSCRLNRNYRVIFQKGYDRIIVIVLEVNKHEY